MAINPKIARVTLRSLMNPLFFVQNNHVERLTIPVAQFARGGGYALEDRSSSRDFDPDACGIDFSEYAPVLPYGSVQFVRSLKGSKALAPYIHHDEERFAATCWLDRLGDRMLNAGGMTIAAEDVPSLLAGADFHVRPNAEDKAFHAQVFDLDAWMRMREGRAFRDDLVCWASPVREIVREWRCWVVGGEMVGASLYRQDGKRELKEGAPSHVGNFVREVASDWMPAECVVLDVAESRDALRAIEFNPIHSSGWYAGEVPRILGAWLDWSCLHAKAGIAGPGASKRP